MCGTGSSNCATKNVVKNDDEKVARRGCQNTRHRNMDVSPAARFQCRAANRAIDPKRKH